MFCLIMIGIAVAITFAVAGLYEASYLDVDSVRLDAAPFHLR